MMKPYFETKLGTLYNCDCIDFMQEMDDNSIDLVLTDPPYGVGVEYDKFLEYGTSRMAPRKHFGNTAARNKVKVKEFIEKSIK